MKRKYFEFSYIFLSIHKFSRKNSTLSFTQDTLCNYKRLFFLGHPPPPSSKINPQKFPINSAKTIPQPFTTKSGRNVHSRTTVCPISSDPFYIVIYYIEWVTNSWTHSKLCIHIKNQITLQKSRIRHKQTLICIMIYSRLK